MVQPFGWSFLPLCFGSSADDTSSPSLQDQETLSLDAAAESTPLSSRGSYKGTSADSSHLHLGAVEMLSLRRSDPLPQKLLAHLAEAGRADLCSLSPYMLRLSGAGFAYYAPGPETSVWPRAWTLCVYESHRLNHTVYPTMCDQALHLKDQGHLEQKYKHAHTCQPPRWAHHVHFSWATPEWTTLYILQPWRLIFTRWVPFFCVIVVPVFTSSTFLSKLTWNSLKTGKPCAKCFCTEELSCFSMSRVWPFCIPHPCLQSHVPFLVLVASLLKTFMYSMWSGQVKGSSLRSAL